MQSYSDFELADLHLESLFELDAARRIVRIREPEPPPTPRFVLTRTHEGNIAVVRDDLPEAIATALLRQAVGEPPLRDAEATPLHLDAYIELLSEHAAIGEIEAGPDFVLLPGPDLPAGVMRISGENSALLEANFDWAARHLEVFSPVFAVVQDGAAVSIAISTREPSRAIEAGVATVEAYQRRGYATRVIAAWAREVAELGHVPLYRTSWDNTASRRTAERLGGELYGVDLSIT